MKAGIVSKAIIVLAAFAIALIVFLAALFVRQEDARRRAGLDFEAYQVLAGVMDVWNAEESFDPSLWRGVNGFGIYGPTGYAVYIWGSAPRSLAGSGLETPAGEVSLVGESLRVIRRAGTAPGDRGLMGRRGMQGPGGMMPNGGMIGSAGSRLVYLDLDVSGRLRERNPLLWLVWTLVAVFIALLALVAVFSRKLAAFRERERETAHLVQLGEAARTLAHEIKNPLGVIRVQCATLSRTIPEERRKNLEVIEEETSRLARLTDRVRDFLNSSAGTPETRDAASYLAQCRLRWGDRISVPDAPEAGGASVRIDPERLVQSLDNLIGNALEATPAEGQIPVLTFETKKGRAFFSVADRGSGIPEEHRSRLFTPFFTTKAKGSGIGLALSRRFVEQAGGTLVWEERPGGGSVFTIALPLEGGV